MILPSLDRENLLWSQGFTVIGIDEVGRGCLAGPVVAGAVAFNPECNRRTIELLGINDSKKLTLHKRESLCVDLPKHTLAYGIGQADVDIINTHGIVHALNVAVKRALDPVISSLNSKSLYILYDGSIQHTHPDIPITATTSIIKGDSISVSIAAASIMAKVFRDRYMIELSRTYPEYKWEENKGYGTQTHRKAVLTYGTTPQHRSLYLRKTLGTL